jgi:DNA gyrase subunit A
MVRFSFFGVINKMNIDKVFEEEYGKYSLSLLMGRAIPSIEDGLLPLHRRIMFEFFQSGAELKKAASYVSEVMSKYHPHSPEAIYESMVKLAQPFNKLHPLLAYNGTVGTLNGDTYAASRYLEMSINQFSKDVYFANGKDSITEYRDNYSYTLKEPVVLNPKYPMLLLNKIKGIACGFTSSIPTFNMKDITNALHLILNGEKDDLKIVKTLGIPDDKSGGFINTTIDKIEDVLMKGCGSIPMVGDVKINNNVIDITAIPLQTPKTVFEKITSDIKSDEFIRNQISNIHNLTDRTNVHIQIELKRSADKEFMYKYSTSLCSTSMSVQCNVLYRNLFHNNISIPQILRHWVDYRLKTLKRNLSRI